VHFTVSRIIFLLIFPIVSTYKVVFDPILYTYVLTAPRYKRTTAHHKFAPNPSSMLDKNQSAKPNGIALEIPQLSSAAAAHDIGSDETSVQGMF
jgi:hypothetical protein